MVRFRTLISMSVTFLNRLLHTIAHKQMDMNGDSDSDNDNDEESLLSPHPSPAEFSASLQAEDKLLQTSTKSTEKMSVKQ